MGLIRDAIRYSNAAKLSIAVSAVFFISGGVKFVESHNYYSNAVSTNTAFAQTRALSDAHEPLFNANRYFAVNPSSPSPTARYLRDVNRKLSGYGLDSLEHKISSLASELEEQSSFVPEQRIVQYRAELDSINIEAGNLFDTAMKNVPSEIPKTLKDNEAAVYTFGLFGLLSLAAGAIGAHRELVYGHATSARYK